MASSNGKNGANGKNKTRMAGTPFGLAPTGFTQNFRGGGTGLTYSGTRPQFGGTAQFGAAGGGNYIDFKPIISQVASPSIQAAGGDIIKEKGKGGVTTESGKGGINKGRGGGGGGGLPSIAESGFNPADYGKKGFGRADLNELRDQGYTDDQIKDYVEKSGVKTGSKAEQQLGLGGTTGGDSGQTADQTQQQTARDKRGATLGLGDVNLRRLDTRVKKYDSPSDAKNILAAFRKATGSGGAKKAENISDERIGKLISEAGIKNFDSRSDATKLTDFLVTREKAKREATGETRQLIKATKQRAADKGEKNIIAQIKREIKQETGARPTAADFNAAVRKANVGKKITAKDTKKIIRAVKKAKTRKRNKKK